MVTDGYWTVHDHFVRYRNVKALCYTPETNVTSFVNRSLKTALHWGWGGLQKNQGRNVQQGITCHWSHT